MTLQEEFEKFKKEENEKWMGVLKNIDALIEQQANIIKILDKITKK